MQFNISDLVRTHIFRTLWLCSRTENYAPTTAATRVVLKYRPKSMHFKSNFFRPTHPLRAHRIKLLNRFATSPPTKQFSKRRAPEDSSHELI